MQMVNANPERNVPVLNFVYHLPKPVTDRFVRVNGKQPCTHQLRLSGEFCCDNGSVGGDPGVNQSISQSHLFRNRNGPLSLRVLFFPNSDHVISGNWPFVVLQIMRK